MKNKMKNMNEEFNQTQKKPKKSQKEKVGEYVDFEELD
jgi:hypothetical protein